MGEIMLQGSLLAAAGLIFIYRLLKLRQVIQPLLTALGAQQLLISALVQNIRQYISISFSYIYTLRLE